MLQTYKYVINKFFVFLPYELLATFVLYAFYILGFLNKDILKAIKYTIKMFLEMFFLGEFIGNNNFPLWYMSVLFVSLPVFILLLRYLNKILLLLLSVIYYVIWYNLIKNFGNHNIPFHFLRCFAGLFAGVFTYHICFTINKLKPLFLN